MRVCVCVYAFMRACLCVVVEVHLLQQFMLNTMMVWHPQTL